MANLTVKEVINSLWTKVKEKTDTVSKEVSDLSKRVDGINLTIPEPFLRNTQQTTDYVYQRIARIIVDNIEIDETGKWSVILQRNVAFLLEGRQTGSTIVLLTLETSSVTPTGDPVEDFVKNGLKVNVIMLGTKQDLSIRACGTVKSDGKGCAYVDVWLNWGHYNTSNIYLLGKDQRPDVNLIVLDTKWNPLKSITSPDYPYLQQFGANYEYYGMGTHIRQSEYDKLKDYNNLTNKPGIATEAADGLMSAADKKLLDRMADNPEAAEVYGLEGSWKRAVIVVPDLNFIHAEGTQYTEEATIASIALNDYIEDDIQDAVVISVLTQDRTYAGGVARGYDIICRECCQGYGGSGWHIVLREMDNHADFVAYTVVEILYKTS